MKFEGFDINFDSHNYVLYVYLRYELYLKKNEPKVGRIHI